MFSSLRSRIFLILLLAVIPPAAGLGLMAWQSYGAAREAVLTSLTQDAELLASRLDGVATGAGRTSMVLAGIGPYIRSSQRECSARLGAIFSAYEGYDALAFYDGGRMICEVRAADAISTETAFDGLAPASIPVGQVVRNTTSLPSGSSLLWVGGRDASGRYSVVVTIDPSYLGSFIRLYHGYLSSRGVLVDASGAPISPTENGLDPGMWPAEGIDLAVGSRARTARSVSGEDYVYTTRKLSSFDVWLVTAGPVADVLGQARRQFVISSLAPLVLLLVAALAIWFGLDRAVLRWVNALIAANRAWSGGETEARLMVSRRAPREFSELALSFNGLAGRIAERTVELEREVDEKRRYLRELHHRVKNNLQVIASLLSLQKRSLPPDMRSILRFPEERVNAMSAVYRTTYADDETGHVAVGPVVREVAGRLQDVCGVSHAALDLTVRGEDRRIQLDAAVSLAMLLAEVLPDFFDAAGRSGIAVRVEVEISATTLVIDISGSGELPQRFFKLSRRFVDAYLRQLSGILEEAEPGRVRIVCDMAAIAVVPPEPLVRTA